MNQIWLTDRVPILVFQQDAAVLACSCALDRPCYLVPDRLVTLCHELDEHQPRVEGRRANSVLKGCLVSRMDMAAMVVVPVVRPGEALDVDLGTVLVVPTAARQRQAAFEMAGSVMVQEDAESTWNHHGNPWWSILDALAPQLLELRLDAGYLYHSQTPALHQHSQWPTHSESEQVRASVRFLEASQCRAAHDAGQPVVLRSTEQAFETAEPEWGVEEQGE